MQNAESSSPFDDFATALQGGSPTNRVVMLRDVIDLLADLLLSKADRRSARGNHAVYMASQAIASRISRTTLRRGFARPAM